MGYAFVAIEGPDPVRYTGDLRAELCHISVADGERGNGVGTALLDAVDAELERRGVEDVEIGVDTANHDAVRLYEKQRLQGRLPHLLRLTGQEALGLPRARGTRPQGRGAGASRAARRSLSQPSCGVDTRGRGTQRRPTLEFRVGNAVQRPQAHALTPQVRR